MNRLQKYTMISSCVAYIIQATVNNLSPLLFVMFNEDMNVSLDKLAIIIVFNFFFQMATDLLSPVYLSKLGVRACVIIAHIFSSVGFISLGVLPYLFSDAFIGILIATLFLAMGGGLIEVLVSPIINSLPSNNKSGIMSVLHSFYCWGQVLTILISTLALKVFGMWNWRFISFGWALLPIVNLIPFIFVPLDGIECEEASAKQTPLKQRLKSILTLPFFLLVVLMISAGACELAISQWSSYFFESVIKIDKTAGDILGPCLFALTMGIGRLAILALRRVKIENILIFSGILCIIGYLSVSLSTIPAISLLGCAICGLSVSSMWPSTYSLGPEYCKGMGTMLFSFFAFFGDIGCGIGPAIVSGISGAVEKGFLSNFLLHTSADASERGMHIGFLAIIIFPIMTIISSLLLKRISKKRHALDKSKSHG